MFNTLSVTLLTIICFAVGSVALAVHCLVTGIPFNHTAYMLYCACTCFVAAGVYQRYSYRKVAKEQLYQELQAYLTECINRIPELQGSEVRLRISDSVLFNASVIMGNRITITRAWYSAAAVNEECLEYLKSTLCHELYHISCRHCSPFSIVNLFIAITSFIPRRIRLRDTALLASWYEELCADRAGCIWYGDRTRFLAKMESMRRLNQGSCDCLSTHPTWDIRIRYITDDIIPTPENVAEEYQKYFEAFSARRRERKHSKR